MISLSNKKIKTFLKLGIIFLLLFAITHTTMKAVSYYKNSYEKEQLQLELKKLKHETINIRQQKNITKKRIENLKKRYIKKDELKTKVTDIFKRMSLFDYNLQYLDSKKMCIDRYVIVAQLTSKSQEGKKAGLGILKYIGETKQSQKSDSIYFIDYIAKETK